MARLLFPNGSGARKKKKRKKKEEEEGEGGRNLQSSARALTDAEGSEKLVKVDN